MTYECFDHVEAARTLADVGVRGNKLYLAAMADNLPKEFATTRVLPGVVGVSATKDIWRQFSSDVNRNLLFVMPADATLKLNRLVRIGYDDPKKLLANNASVFRRIMPMANVVASVLKRITQKVKTLGGDHVTVSNMAEDIMSHAARNGNLTEDTRRLPTDLDVDSFGPMTALGLDLSTPERFANLYHQAAKGSGRYGKDYARFFAPSNRTKWLPAINAALVEQASIYADEAEWVNKRDALVIPEGTHVIYATNPRYDGPDAKPSPMGWMKYEEEAIARIAEVKAILKESGLKYSVVSSRKVVDGMQSAKTRRDSPRRPETAMEVTLGALDKAADLAFGPMQLSQGDLAQLWTSSAIAPRRVGKQSVQARLAVPGELVVTEINGKEETRKTANAGDVVVKNVTGEEYVLPADTFGKQYIGLPLTLDYATYNSVGFRYAIPYSGRETTLLASWGEAQAITPGDFLACLSPNPNGDIYRIERTAFEQGYHYLDAGGLPDPRTPAAS